jgi:hypothetical protein
MRYRLRTLLILVAIVPPLLALLYHGPVIATWSGGFTLNVELKNATGKGIGHVDAAVLHSRDEAAIVIEHLPSGGGPWKPCAVDARGVVAIRISCSGRTTWLGRDTNYWHEPVIAFRVGFDDGSQSLFAVDIPPQRGVRELMVHVPDASP